MINRECPKCGQMNAAVKHNPALEQLDLECMLCGYKWATKPLDVIRADREKRLAGSATGDEVAMPMREWHELAVGFERYKQALQRANGFLIMHNLEPVKLEYSPPTVGGESHG